MVPAAMVEAVPAVVVAVVVTAATVVVASTATVAGGVDVASLSGDVTWRHRRSANGNKARSYRLFVQKVPVCCSWKYRWLEYAGDITTHAHHTQPARVPKRHGTADHRRAVQQHPQGHSRHHLHSAAPHRAGRGAYSSSESSESSESEPS